jgi:hypothetical protein
MKIHTTDRFVLLEPVKLVPPAQENAFGLILPATSIDPHPHIARMACSSEKLRREEGIEEGDLVVFSLKHTHFEMPFHGYILLVVDMSNVHGKVELEQGWTVIADRDPMPQELAPAFARDGRTTSPSIPNLLTAQRASLADEPTNPDPPAPLVPLPGSSAP